MGEETKMIQFEWAPGRELSISAEVAGQAVEDIVATQGRCEPQSLVEAARNPAHPLHAYFEWNDEAAAEAYRRSQARRLIASIQIRYVARGVERVAPAFASVGRLIETKELGSGYRPIRTVMETPAFRDEAMREAMTSLNAIKRRFSDLEGLAEVWQAIESVESDRFVSTRM